MGGGTEKYPSATPRLPFSVSSVDKAQGWSKNQKSPLYRILRILLLASLTALAVFNALLPSLRSLPVSSIASLQATTIDPADEWRDDIWPLRPQTHWDISTDFPYPRRLEYDVQEGTWLRLDVHPVTGEIVFDMLGDIYCLTNSSYFSLHTREKDGARATALPILLGVPHDSDPHFSPEGDRLVFRSDAGLGVENIWVVKWSGCESMQLRPAHAEGELKEALKNMENEESLLAGGVAETEERRRRRLVREGRLGAQMVTNETYRWTSDARFHPSGEKLIATKWYTSGRSLGAGEGWEYSVPSITSLTSDAEQRQVKVGSGKRIIGRKLSAGWSAEQYGDQQIGPEQLVWRGEDALIYAINVADTDGQFTYSKDVHKGVYAIFSRNLTTNQTETLVDAFPGGASRPELSRDGKTLAFVRRVRDQEVLVLKNLESGTIHYAWDGLTYDLTQISAPMGTYPSFAFTPSDDGIIIWSSGQLYLVPLALNAFGEKIAVDTPRVIPFTAHIEKRLAETRSSQTDLLKLETREWQRVHAFKELSVDDAGVFVAFNAAGVTYVKIFYDDLEWGPEKVPVLQPSQPYYSPSFVPTSSSRFVLHARWSDITFSTFEIADLETGEAYELEGIPRGRYHSPVTCGCEGSRRRIAFLKTGGDTLTGDIVATAGAGLYIGYINLPSSSSSHRIAVHNLTFVPSEIDPSDIAVKIRFVEENTKLLVQQAQRAFVIDIAAGPDNLGNYKHEVLASGRMSVELAVSRTTEPIVAFVETFQLYVAPNVTANALPVWSKPGNSTAGLVRVSLDGAHDISWSGNGKRLVWFLGPYLHTLEVSELAECSAAIKADTSTFGIDCVKNLVKYVEIVVEHKTDIGRLKDEAITAAAARGISGEELANADVLIIANATLITMSSGQFDTDIVRDSALVVRGGVIESIDSMRYFFNRAGATVIDAEGGFVVPGFIDVHAHWNGFYDRYPARSWELEIFLAYGVTTLHNPSSENVQGFDERNRVESGQMFGSRIFHTGRIIYGAGEPSFHQDIVDMEEARSALLRIKVEGGPASFSYKNYNIPSRASRQRLLLAARDLSMLCVPEGGMNQDWDLTYIIDGMTTVEHPLPIPVLYDDVLTLYALSGTGSTPTHIVNYGSVMGEQFIWASNDIPNDPKVWRFSRHDILESITESTARPRQSYQLFNTSQSVAKMVHKGLKAHIGAHGEPPMGYNYHAEMFFAQEGGLDNYEVLRAATSDAAITLGLDSSLGSLSSGKLADFLVYPPGVDLLEDDIGVTKDIRYVARGGRIWDAPTMVEKWPVKGRKHLMPPINAD